METEIQSAYQCLQRLNLAEIALRVISENYSPKLYSKPMTKLAKNLAKERDHARIAVSKNTLCRKLIANNGPDETNRKACLKYLKVQPISPYDNRLFTNRGETLLLQLSMYHRAHSNTLSNLTNTDGNTLKQLDDALRLIISKPKENTSLTTLKEARKLQPKAYKSLTLVTEHINHGHQLLLKRQNEIVTECKLKLTSSTQAVKMTEDTGIAPSLHTGSKRSSVLLDSGPRLFNPKRQKLLDPQNTATTDEATTMNNSRIKKGGG